MTDIEANCKGREINYMSSICLFPAESHVHLLWGWGRSVLEWEKVSIFYLFCFKKADHQECELYTTYEYSCIVCINMYLCVSDNVLTNKK